MNEPTKSCLSGSICAITARIPVGMRKLPTETIGICCTTSSEVFGFPISLAKRRGELGFRKSRYHYGDNAPLDFSKIQMRGIVSSVDCVLQPVDSRIGEESRMVTDKTVVKPGVQRYLLAIEYDGTRFSGSQWQPDRRTVVGVLQVFQWFFHTFVINVDFIHDFSWSCIV